MDQLEGIFEGLYEKAPEWRELVQQKRDYFLKSGLSISVKDLSIEVHNATWCPDCVREVTELMALITLCQNPITLKVISYEDREAYKDAKENGRLPIDCLPTIIFKKSDKEICRVKESSNGDLSKAFQL